MPGMPAGRNVIIIEPTEPCRTDAPKRIAALMRVARQNGAVAPACRHPSLQTPTSEPPLPT